MPASKKQPGTQQDQRPQRARVTPLPVPPRDVVPPLPDVQGGLLPASEAAWTRLHESVVAGLVNEVDLVVAERWLLALDEHLRAIKAFRRRRFVEGSTGQPVLNPLSAWITARESALERCEKQLGIGPKFRMDLGISAGQARLTAAELNRMAEETVERGDVIDVDSDLLEEFEADA